MEDKAGDSPAYTYQNMTATMPRNIQFKRRKGIAVQSKYQYGSKCGTEITLHSGLPMQSTYSAMDGHFVNVIITFPNSIAWDYIAHVFCSLFPLPPSIRLFYSVMTSFVEMNRRQEMINFEMYSR